MSKRSNNDSGCAIVLLIGLIVVAFQTIVKWLSALFSWLFTTPPGIITFVFAIIAAATIYGYIQERNERERRCPSQSTAEQPAASKPSPAPPKLERATTETLNLNEKRDKIAQQSQSSASRDDLRAAMKRIENERARIQGEHLAEEKRQHRIEEMHRQEILDSDASDWNKAIQLCPFLSKDFSNLTPDDFELWVCDLLRNLGYEDVEHVGGSGDFGLDAIAKKDGTKYGFQCKYYGSPVGQEAVREAFAGINHYACDKAVVVTNASYTSAAKTLAHDCRVKLWDGNSLQKLRQKIAWQSLHDDE